MQTIRFTVTGQGEFPIDMLRYDACHPYTPQDVSNIDGGLRLEEGRLVTRLVTLIHNAAGRGWRPTDGRWNSFGWDVRDVEVYT